MASYALDTLPSNSSDRVLKLFTTPDVSQFLVVNYLHKSRDILNLCLTNKRYYALFIHLLYRNNVRHQGGSALVWAAQYGKVKVARAILSLPNIEHYAPRTMWSFALRTARRFNKIWVAVEILAMKQVKTGEIDMWSDILRGVCVAANCRQNEMVEVLLDGASPSDRSDFAPTALWQAVANDNIHLVWVLLTKYAVDPTQSVAKNLSIDLSRKLGELAIRACIMLQDKTPPLILAATYGHSEIVRLLMDDDRVDPNAQSDEGPRPTALIEAIAQGHLNTVQMLLSNKDVDPDKVDDCELTPLMHAAQSRRESAPEVLRYLLSEPRIDPNGRNKLGRTAVMQSIISGEWENLKILLQDPRVRLDQVDNYGWTAMIHAACSIHPISPRMLRLLAQDLRVDPNKTEPVVGSPLANAINCGLVKNALALIQSPRVDPDQVDCVGETPLMMACRRRYFKVVDKLLATNRVNPDKRSRQGHPAWMYAINALPNESKRSQKRAEKIMLWITNHALGRREGQPGPESDTVAAVGFEPNKDSDDD